MIKKSVIITLLMIFLMSTLLISQGFAGFNMMTTYNGISM